MFHVGGDDKIGYIKTMDYCKHSPWSLRICYMDKARVSATTILPIMSRLPKVNTVTIILMTPSI